MGRLSQPRCQLSRGAQSLNRTDLDQLGEPFPASVEKGLDYGEVDAVAIGADSYG